MMANQMSDKSKQLKMQNDVERDRMNKEIKNIKQETVRHHRRLEKRKAEEIEKGVSDDSS